MAPDKTRSSSPVDRFARATAPTWLPAPIEAPAPSTVRFFDSAISVFPAVRLPLRSMLVESPTMAILVSPIGRHSELAAIDGKLCVLVAPSLFHHRRLEHAIATLAPRELWGPPGLSRKLPHFAEARVFGVDPWPHDDVLSFAIVEGAPARNEVVFFHRPSRTLYTADLALAIMEPEGLATKIALHAAGVYKRFGVARAWKRWIEDPVAFRRSIDRILAWDFDRLAMAHGEIVERGAREQLFVALRERGLI